jgi:hypothetical protein
MPTAPESPPSSESENAKPAARPFVSLSRRSEIVSNLAARAARTPPATRAEEIAGLPIGFKPADEAGEQPDDDGGTGAGGAERP